MNLPNHPLLLGAVKLYFADPKCLKECSVFETTNKGHGRIEYRKCYVTDQIEGLNCRQDWKKLQCLVMVESVQIKKGKSTKEVRYFLTSLSKETQKILRSVRTHWLVESMHWILDVVFNEDQRIIWNKNIAHNESIMRRIALNLLKGFQNRLHINGKPKKVAIKSLRKILIAQDDSMESLLKGFNQ